jgi:hypothetical protein
MTSNDKYQGWTNRETWSVNLWLSNDHGLYDLVNGLAETAKDENPQNGGTWSTDLDGSYSDAAIALADDLEDTVEQMVLGDEPPANLATDLLTHALGMVEYREIAAAWLEGME